MDLSPQEQAMLQQTASVSTELGLVAILGFNESIPEGWDRLTMEEGNQILAKLKSILTEWSIVAYQLGCLTGRGYKYEIHKSYGTECGEGFIIKHTNRHRPLK